MMCRSVTSGAAAAETCTLNAPPAPVATLPAKLVADMATLELCGADEAPRACGGFTATPAPVSAWLPRNSELAMVVAHHVRTAPERKFANWLDWISSVPAWQTTAWEPPVNVLPSIVAAADDRMPAAQPLNLDAEDPTLSPLSAVLTWMTGALTADVV